MSTHNICFYGELSKIICKLSSDTLICCTAYYRMFSFVSVISLKGVPYRSGPIRIRVKNGSWITTKTEWSSFVNPWTKRLEFIIGKHTIVK